LDVVVRVLLDYLEVDLQEVCFLFHHLQEKHKLLHHQNLLVDLVQHYNNDLHHHL
jgi:hypothetical protein